MNFGEWDAGPTSLQLPRVVSDGERRPDGTFGIVLVSSRNAKDRHEPVSHHLGDGPAVVLYDPHQRGHARPHERVDFFRIERRRECGEPGQVREQQRDELPLAARRWGRRSSRGGAEARSYTEGPRLPPDVHAVAELVQDNWPCARPFDIGGDNSALRGNAAQGFDGWGTAGVRLPASFPCRQPPPPRGRRRRFL